MTTLLDSLSNAAAGWIPFLSDVSLKTLVILLLALGATGMLRGASASVRHHVWTLAFVAVLALPILAVSLPTWRVSVPGWTSGVSPQVPTAAVQVASAPVPPEPSVSSPNAVDWMASGAASAIVSGAAPTVESGLAVDRSLPAGTLLKGAILVWLGGLSLLLLRLGVGVVSAWWTSRRAERLDDPEWELVVAELCEELEIKKPVRILTGPWFSTPMAWGILSPALLLPTAAVSWSAERRRAVLLHELAHVKRHDCLTHIVAQAVRAFHWFNPLAWVGARRLRAERERACDDLVITSGTRRSDYAKLLLDVARARMDRRLTWATVSMARPSELEGRLLAILDPVRDRRGMGRPAAIATVGLVAGILGPLAVLRAVPQDPSEAETVAPIASTIEVDARVSVAPKARTRTTLSVQDDAQESRAISVMLEALRSDRPGIRSQAAHSLGMLESPLAVEGLSSAVRSDGTAEVRSQAAWALGMIESPEGVASLLPALRDESGEVRSQAAWALGMIENDGAVEGLARALTSDDSNEVRSQSAWALGMIESAEAVDGLIRALATDNADEVRSQSAWALGMIEDQRAIGVHPLSRRVHGLSLKPLLRAAFRS